MQFCDQYFTENWWILNSVFSLKTHIMSNTLFKHFYSFPSIVYPTKCLLNYQESLVLPLTICKDLLSDKKGICEKKNHLKRSFVFQQCSDVFFSWKQRMDNPNKKPKGNSDLRTDCFFFKAHKLPESDCSAIIFRFLTWWQSHKQNTLPVLIKVKWIIFKCIQGCLYAKEAHSLTFKDDLIWFCVASHLSFTLQARNLL